MPKILLEITRAYPLAYLHMWKCLKLVILDIVVQNYSIVFPLSIVCLQGVPSNTCPWQARTCRHRLQSTFEGLLHWATPAQECNCGDLARGCIKQHVLISKLVIAVWSVYNLLASPESSRPGRIMLCRAYSGESDATRWKVNKILKSGQSNVYFYRTANWVSLVSRGRKRLSRGWNWRTDC